MDGTLLTFQGCTASAGLATALVFQDGWGTMLTGYNFRRSRMAAPDTAITVLPPVLRPRPSYILPT